MLSCFIIVCDDDVKVEHKHRDVDVEIGCVVILHDLVRCSAFLAAGLRLLLFHALTRAVRADDSIMIVAVEDRR